MNFSWNPDEKLGFYEKGQMWYSNYSEDGKLWISIIQFKKMQICEDIEAYLQHNLQRGSSRRK